MHQRRHGFNIFIYCVCDTCSITADDMDAVTSIETKQRENRVDRAAVTAQSTSLRQRQLGATWANTDIYGRSEKSGLLL